MRIRTFASGRDWLSYETALSPFMAIRGMILYESACLWVTKMRGIL